MKEEKNLFFTSVFGNISRIFFVIFIYILLSISIYKESFAEISELVTSVYNSNFYIFNIILFFLFIILIFHIYLDYLKLSIMIYLEKKDKSKFDYYSLDETKWNIFNIFSPLGYRFQGFFGRREFTSNLFLGDKLKLDDFLIKQINLYRTSLYSFYIIILVLIIVLEIYN